MRVTASKVFGTPSVAFNWFNGKCATCTDNSATISDLISQNADLESALKFAQSELEILTSSHQLVLAKNEEVSRLNKESADQQEETYRIRLNMVEERCTAKDQRINQLVEDQRRLREESEDAFRASLQLENLITELNQRLQERDQCLVAKEVKISELAEALRVSREEAAVRDDRHEDLITAESKIRQLEAKLAEREEQWTHKLHLKNNHIEELNRKNDALQNMLKVRTRGLVPPPPLTQCSFAFASPQRQQQENLKLRTSKNNDAVVVEHQLSALKEDLLNTKVSEAKLARDLREGTVCTALHNPCWPPLTKVLFDYKLYQLRSTLRRRNSRHSARQRRTLPPRTHPKNPRGLLVHLQLAH